MSTAFDSIKRGLLEAIEHAEDHSPQIRRMAADTTYAR